MYPESILYQRNICPCFIYTPFVPIISGQIQIGNFYLLMFLNRNKPIMGDI